MKEKAFNSNKPEDLSSGPTIDRVAHFLKGVTQTTLQCNIPGSNKSNKPHQEDWRIVDEPFP